MKHKENVPCYHAIPIGPISPQLLVTLTPSAMPFLLDS